MSEFSESNVTEPAVALSKLYAECERLYKLYMSDYHRLRGQWTTITEKRKITQNPVVIELMAEYERLIAASEEIIKRVDTMLDTEFPRLEIDHRQELHARLVNTGQQYRTLVEYVRIVDPNFGAYDLPDVNDNRPRG